MEEREFRNLFHQYEFLPLNFLPTDRVKELQVSRAMRNDFFFCGGAQDTTRRSLLSRM